MILCKSHCAAIHTVIAMLARPEADQGEADPLLASGGSADDEQPASAVIIDQDAQLTDGEPAVWDDA